MKEKGQVEIWHLLTAGTVTVILSIIGAIYSGGVDWGTATEKIATLEREQTAIRQEVKHIPGILKQLERVFSRLDQIADKVGAPPAKE